jgi:UDP:flavonoid glycosyltransferase YjiC (YdhE family)
MTADLAGSAPGKVTGRFLLAMIDGGGTVPPALGLAAGLVRRGHQVRVLADPTVAAAARSAGCAFTSWRTAPHFDSLTEQTALIAAMEARSPWGQFAAARDLLICGPADKFAADVRETAEQWPVDAILAEAALPGILIGAESTGLPTAALMANIYLRPTPGLPLFGTGWLPARGLLGRARDRLAAAAFRRVWSKSLPGLNATRTGYGLPAIGDLYEVLDHCARVLVMTSPTFDFAAPQLPGNVRYVGPQLDDPDWAGDAAWRPPGDDPLVLVGMSSIYQNQTGVLRRVAAAMSELPVRAVITTGRAVDPDQIEAAGNIRVVTSAPHREILPESAVVITHAGHGTVLKTLAAGVPLVCVPMGRDQADNTVRVLRLGAGVRVKKTAGSRQFAAAVRQVLDQPSYAHAANSFTATLAREAETRPTAIDEAETLLTLGRSRRRGG